MSSTRLLIRQTAAARLGGLTTGTSTSAYTATQSIVTDTATLQDSGRSENDFIGAFFHFTSGSNTAVEQRISSYVNTTGSVVVGGVGFTSNVGIGDTYEIHEHLSVAEWNAAINNALRRCTRRREQAITIVDDQLQYSMASVADLTRDNQILDVFTEQGDAAKKWRNPLMKNMAWWTTEDDDVLQLWLASALKANAATNFALMVAYLGPYPALATDAATTTCDLDWVVTGTLLHALEAYPGRLEEAAKRNLKMTAADFQKEFLRHSMVQAATRGVSFGLRFT